MDMWIAIGAVAVLSIMALYHTIFIQRFIRLISLSEPKLFPDDQLPRVALLMGLRGADPFLLQSLRRIAHQDYPDYELHIVVDSMDDPAWPVVQQVIAETDGHHIHVQLYENRPDCGPVNSTNSKVVQAARALDDSFEVMAMADADLMAHPSWLRELVSPLVADQKVGVTFGNRWFVPPDHRWGTLVRYMWGAFAMVSMSVLKMPWGGCYAIRMSAVRRGNLVEQWAKIVALDCATLDLMRPQQLKVEFVPCLIMPNFEGCDLGFSANFIRRQLTWARLYHPHWFAVVVQGLSVTTCLFLTLVLLGRAAVIGDPSLALWCMGTWALFLVPRFLLMFQLEFAVRRVIARQGTVKRWMRLPHLLKMVPAGVLCHYVHVTSLLLATFARRVNWRGITLDIRGPFDIRTIGTTNQLVAASDPHTSI